MPVRDTPRTFHPATGAALPDLAVGAAAAAGGEATAPQQLEVVSTYLDTAELDLLAHGATLHRDQGGPDDAWVLELPDGDGGVELVRAALSGGRLRPPASLRHLLLGLTLDAPFVEVASLRLERQLVVLPDGGSLVDDHVAATRLHPPDAGDGAGADPTTWREWTLTPAPDDLETGPSLDELVDALSAVAEPATHPGGHAERLRRALGTAVPVPSRPRTPKPRKPARRVLHRYLLAQHEAVLAADLAVRRHEVDGVHDLRSSLRRLRSALATYAPLLDTAHTIPLRERMREVSHLLGDARDAQVVSGRLTRLLDDEPADLRLGAARRTIGDDGRTTLRLARRTVTDTLRSEDYLAVLRTLRALVLDPPWGPEAGTAAAEVVPERVARDLRRLRSRIAAVDDADGSAERARLLHEARKAAKRLRHACEAAEPVVGADARRLRVAAADLQEVLGDHHDTMATRSALRRLAGRGDLHAGTAFTLGRLHAREEQAARRLEREVPDAWARLDRSKVTGWL